MKRKLRFTLKHRPKDKFVVGTIYRFKWADLYRALQIVNSQVHSEELRVKLTSLMGSTREMVHNNLFEVLQSLEYDKSVKTDLVKCAGWIIACYGYTKGLSTLTLDESSTSWPHPAPLKKRRKTRFYDYRVELKCPICGRRFEPPKRYKTKAVILKWFGVQLKNHLEREAH